MYVVGQITGAWLFSLALVIAAGAQAPPSLSPAEPVFSIGQPPRWDKYVAGMAMEGRAAPGAGSALFGLHHAILSPVTGLLGVSAEAYGTIGGSFSGPGARLLGSSRALGLGAGADWSIGAHRVDLVLSYQTAVRRGGLLGHGSMVRLDWLPTRSRTFGIGMNLPLDRLAGRTRPRRTDVDVPDAGSRAHSPDTPARATPDIDSSLARAAAAMELIRLYTSLYSDRDQARLVALPATFDGAMRSYAASLARAFGIAARDSALGARIASRARSDLLDGVIVPYDSLFGQAKRQHDLGGLFGRARDRFGSWLRDSSRVGASAVAAVMTVEDRWLESVSGVHRELLAQWKDSRLVWLPLQLALTPEEYDEQIEVDSLVSRLVGRPFTDDNALTYLRSTDLPLEIARSIYAARDYHVLWVHDFAGQRLLTGSVDNIGYEMVADVYLPALTEAVKRYGSTGQLPVYMIVLDQYFYEPGNGRLWMSILENPLHAPIHLPGHEPEREAHLRARQTELRQAVAAASRLQRDASRLGGDHWLSRTVAVHVNITQRSDFSFRSHRIVPGIPFAPDNLMRDHRKIAFYDLNEADPYRGGMLMMGVGIGEHYASATWEDRGYRIRGAAALEARAALRRLLTRNGFSERDIPAPLRVVRGAPADSTTERRMNRGQYVGRALQVHNDVGFARKESSIARALLYSLTPPGSVVIVPDPLWLSDTWAAMLAAAAARGSHVVIIGPARENAPSPEPPLMARAHDVFEHLLDLQHRVGGRMKTEGGELRIGLYTARAPVNDVQGRVRELRAGLARAPWIQELIPFDAKTLAVLDRAAMQTAVDGGDATALAHDERARPPQLHQKTQLFARPGAIAALLRQPGWDDALTRAMRVQSQQTAKFAEQLRWETPDVDTLATKRTDAMLRGYEQTLSAADRKRVSFYFSLGTQNEDPRGLVSDGEASILVSGFDAASGLVDLYYIMARSTWITTPAELDKHLPRGSWLWRRFAWLVRFVL